MISVRLLIILCILAQTVIILAALRMTERNINMATQADLDAALNNLMAAITAKATQIANDLAALNAKIQAIPNAPDLSAEVAQVQSGIDAINAIDPQNPTP